jgi:dTDP-D-glucose 4,6-dehydratase
MCIKKIRDGQTVTIHSDKTKKIPGSRHYIHAEDVSEALLFILNNKIKNEVDWGGAKCPKFNIVGSEELTNLELAEIIAKSQNKKLNYEMVDFHSSRPGHDLRYSLSGEKMKSMGWTPKIKVQNRIKQVVEWSLDNPSWIEL